MAAIELKAEGSKNFTKRVWEKFRDVKEDIKADLGWIMGRQVFIWALAVGIPTAAAGIWADSQQFHSPGGIVNINPYEGRFKATASCFLKFSRNTAFISISDTGKEIFPSGTTTRLDYDDSHIKEVFSRAREPYSIITEVYQPRESIKVTIYDSNVSGQDAQNNRIPIISFNIPNPCD